MIIKNIYNIPGAKQKNIFVEKKIESKTLEKKIGQDRGSTHDEEP